jgi:peptidoglycan hydrolase CwlO-like protein
MSDSEQADAAIRLDDFERNISTLKRRVDELESMNSTALAGITKLTRLIDTVSKDLRDRYKDLEIELTYHMDSPHNVAEIVYK